MRVAKSCAGPEAASARLSFDRAPAASDGVRFDGKGMRTPCDEDVPAGFVRAEKGMDASEYPEFEGLSLFNGHVSLKTPLRGKRKNKANGGARFARKGELLPIRSRFGSETCFALSDDDADGFETRSGHAATAGPDGNPARDGVSGRGRPNASAIRSSEKLAEGCEKWMRGDRTTTSRPKPCETSLLGNRASGGAHSELPPNPGEAPYAPSLNRPGLAPSRTRPGHAEAATSAACALPFARGGTKSRQSPSSGTEPESSAVAAKSTKAKVAFGHDECATIKADAPLPEAYADRFAAAFAPLSPMMRKRALHDAIIAKQDVYAAQAVDSVPPPLVERSGMDGRIGFRFMKEKPGFARLALEGKGRLDLGFAASSASAIIESGFELLKEFAP